MAVYHFVAREVIAFAITTVAVLAMIVTVVGQSSSDIGPDGPAIQTVKAERLQHMSNDLGHGADMVDLLPSRRW
jgi:hypothetical protein